MKILDTLGKTKKAIGGVVATCILTAVIFFAGTVFGGEQSELKITSTALTQQLQEANDLVATEYNYTKVGKFENPLTLNGWNIPLAKKSFLLTYAGQLKVGVRMDQAGVGVKGRTIAVLLSEVEILSNTIDEKSIEVYDETKNTLNPISIEDYTAFAIQQKDKVMDGVVENGLLSEAMTKPQSAIRKFFNMTPEIKEQHSIEVKFKS